MSTKSTSINRRTSSTVEHIVFWGLCLLLSIGPYFRGLYFEKELFPAQIITFILGLVWLMHKSKDKDYKLIKSKLDYLVIGLVFMYFISIIYGVSARLAIGEALKYGNYLVIYILARDIISTQKQQRNLLNILILSGVGVALLGIGSAIGTWEYNGAVIGGRISSTFQYPNTLASYVVAIFILVIGLIIIEKNNKLKALYGVASSLMLFTLILTYSRGMWLILPFLLVLLFLIMPNKRKLETIAYTATSAISSVPLAFIFTAKLSNGGSTSLWAIVIGLIIASALLTYIVGLIANKLQKVSMKLLFIVIAIMVALLGAGVVVALNTTTELTMSNNTDTDKWTVVTRNVGGIQPNQEYELKVKYTGTNTNEKPHMGRIRVHAVGLENEKEKAEQINVTEIKELQGELNINLTTLDNTESLKFYFDNYYTDTAINYIEAKVSDKNGTLIKELPLKYKYIPETIYGRFQSIDVKENSSQARVAFYKDAFKVIKDYPVLGTGGGGWVVLYQMYQSYLYWTTQAHNYFLQMWIEVGTVGLGLFLAFLALLTFKLFKVYRKTEDEIGRIVLAIVFTSTLGILVHAFMDFDLALVSLTNIMWALLGILASSTLLFKVGETSPNKAKNKYVKPKASYVTAVSTVCISIMLLGTGSLAISDNYKEKGLEANQKQDMTQAVKHFEKAAKLDPFKPEYRMDIGSFYRAMYSSTGSPDYLKKAANSVDKGLSLAQYNTRLQAVGSSFFMSIGQVDKALEIIDNSVELQPMRTENYLQKGEAYLTAFYHFIDQGEMEKAKEVIERGYSIKQEIKDINEQALRPLTYSEELLYTIGYLQFNYENLKNQEYEIEDGYTLDFAYYFDLDINDDGNLDMLLSWSAEGGNIDYETIEEQDSNFIRITNDESNYGIVYPYGLKMEPDKEYKVMFKAKGNVSENTFRFLVYDNNAEKKTQADLGYVALNEDWNVYELSFETDSDIKPGAQYLRFQHGGKEDGYVDIEEVIVLKK